MRRFSPTLKKILIEDMNNKHNKMSNNELPVMFVIRREWARHRVLSL